MSKRISIRLSIIFIAFALLAITSINAFAAPVIRTASGANAGAIQTAVDQFRTDLGANNGVGGSFTSGRREINWDGVPDNFSSPNNLPANFFNANSPRGAVFTTPCSNATFRVSADSNNPTTTPVRFGELDPSYTTAFTTFSAERLFTVISGSAVPCNILDISFFIPGTKIPATVSGFGVVFTDVDITGNARILAYGPDGSLLSPGFMAPTASNGGLSFVGVSYNAGERIAHVQIVSGTDRLAAGNVDGVNGVDAVAMDDFIYGEPRAMQYHPSDFDGDGTSDLSVFRPSTGTWFVLNSGSGTVNIAQFGVNGDVPIEGDFDGDSLSDIAVWRPSSGVWFVFRSSDGQVLIVPFGTAGDKPVPGDYDKDGKTDPAVYRPSSGTWFHLKSSTNYATFGAANFGVNTDIPIPASPNP